MASRHHIVLALVVALFCVADASAAPGRPPRSFSGGPAMSDRITIPNAAKNSEAKEEPRAQPNLKSPELNSEPTKTPKRRSVARSFSGGAPSAATRVTRGDNVTIIR
jgi:FtsP/CotA-like multicopper oxidase with cupredoxin domain